MDERISKLIELTVEALLIVWLGYLTVYQNYLLHNWHRGLPLPSRYPAIATGLAMGVAFFWYEWDKFEKSIALESKANALSDGTGETHETQNPEGSAVEAGGEFEQ